MKHRKQGLKILPHSSLLGGSIAANVLIGAFSDGVGRKFSTDVKNLTGSNPVRPTKILFIKK